MSGGLALKCRLWDLGLRLRALRRPRPPRGVERIACIANAGIGNLVLYTPVLKALRARYPEAHITVVTTPAAAPVVEDGPLADAVIRFPGLGATDAAWSALADRLETLQPDLVIATHAGYRAAWAAARSGARTRVGFRYRLAGLDATAYRWTHAARLDFSRHEVENDLDLLRAIGIPPADRTTACRVRPEDRSHVAALLAARGLARERLVSVHVGSGPDQAFKRWPVTRFVEAADVLHREDGIHVSFVGGPEDAGLLQPTGAAGRHTVVAGTLSLGETAAWLERSEVLLTNDSGPMHMAGAVGTPVVAIFGPTVTSKVHPWGPGTVLQRPLPCRPCHRPHTDRGGCPTLDCLVAVPAAEAVTAIRALLDRAGVPSRTAEGATR